SLERRPLVGDPRRKARELHRVHRRREGLRSHLALTPDTLDIARSRDHGVSVHVGVLVGSLVGAGAVLLYRMRETARPIDARKIVIPPFGMATGLCMFAVPQARVPWSWGLG